MATNSIRLFLGRHPIARGMLAYSITWPTGNIIQQTMDGKRWGNIFAHIFIQKYSFIDSFIIQTPMIGQNAFNSHSMDHCMLHQHYTDG